MHDRYDLEDIIKEALDDEKYEKDHTESRKATQEEVRKLLVQRKLDRAGRVKGDSHENKP